MLNWRRRTKPTPRENYILSLDARASCGIYRVNPPPRRRPTGKRRRRRAGGRSGAAHSPPRINAIYAEISSPVARAHLQRGEMTSASMYVPPLLFGHLAICRHRTFVPPPREHLFPRTAGIAVSVTSYTLYETDEILLT